MDLRRRRNAAHQIQTQQPGDEVEFTERDRRTLVSE
jgi:hypothetical protein